MLRITKTLAVFAILLFLSLPAFTQSFSINTDGSTADPSAALDVKSAAKGVLVPRLTKTERNNIASPATGLLVYQSGPDSAGFYFYDGALWKWLSTATTAQGWNITGNSGTTTSNFIGTTDNIPLSFRQNNNWIGRLDAATRNYFIGGGAGASVSGNSNVAIGDSAFRSGTASQAVVIGTQAGKNNNSTGSIVIGYEAAANNTTPGVAIGYQSQRFPGAASNTSLGSFTLNSGSTGADNVAIGYNSLAANTTGISNVGVGANAMTQNTVGSINTAIGGNSLLQFTKGSGNIALGFASGGALDSAEYSIAIGISALSGFGGRVDTSLNNIALGLFSQFQTRNSIGNVTIGNYTLRNNETGKYNVAVGDSAMQISGNGNLNVAIGRAAGLTMYNANENVYIGAYSGNQTPFNLFNTANNTFVGHRSGINTIDGAVKNTFVGDSSGRFVSTGAYNTLIGANTAVGAPGISNATAIGYRAYATDNNTLILGGINGVNGATADTRVGIGTTTPNSNALFSVSNNFMVQPTGAVQYANSVTNMMYMFESGTGNADRMVISHSAGFPNYGLQYQDGTDKFNFLAAGVPVLTANLSGLSVGVNTSTPNSTLQVDGTFAVGTSMALAGGASGSPASLANARSYIGLQPANGVNNFYQLPNPATCAGRMYIIRNNSGTEIAKLVTAAGLFFAGSSAGGSADYWLNPNSAPKTVMVISDGTNWTVGRMD